ncbi:hypothetical protein EI94DRAFT_183681 [Lactarius quietus]|nr:hypothetical protein EI94DRAFT_183681 [Lactarius quietus]
MDPFSNPNTPVSPAPLLHTPVPMLYLVPAQSSLYAHLITPSLPLAPAPLNGRLVTPPYAPYNSGPTLPAYVGDPLYHRLPPLRPATPITGPDSVSLPVSGTHDHVLSSCAPYPQRGYHITSA